MKTIWNQIETDFKTIFPNGYFKAIAGHGLAGDQIMIDLGLIGNLEDVPNKIRHNDPMHHRFIVFIDHHNQTQPLSIESLISGLSLYPEPESFLAMDTIKTGFRKTKGDNGKIAKTLNNFFLKLKKMVDENKTTIYGHETLEKYL